MTDETRIEQIRRAHASAKPIAVNPAWQNTHRDLGAALAEITRMQEELEGLRRDYGELTKFAKLMPNRIRKVLQRRYDFLMQMSERERDVSYARAEAGALEWVLFNSKEEAS